MFSTFLSLSKSSQHPRTLQCHSDDNAYAGTCFTLLPSRGPPPGITPWQLLTCNLDVHMVPTTLTLQSAMAHASSITLDLAVVFPAGKLLTHGTCPHMGVVQPRPCRPLASASHHKPTNRPDHNVRAPHDHHQPHTRQLHHAPNKHHGNHNLRPPVPVSPSIQSSHPSHPGWPPSPLYASWQIPDVRPHATNLNNNTLAVAEQTNA